MNLGKFLLISIALVAFFSLALGLSALVIMFLFNVIARHFEWREMNFMVALCLSLLLGFIANFISSKDSNQL